MRNILFLFVLFSLLYSCDTNDDVTVTSDLLSENGIFGKWEIEAQGVGNISPIPNLCCDFITFSPDTELRDFNGIYEADGPGFYETGRFTINIDTHIITLTADEIYGSETTSASIIISSERLKLFDDVVDDITTDTEVWWSSYVLLGEE